MITVKDLKDILIECHNNPLSRSIRVHIQCVYAHTRYDNDKDVELDPSEYNIKELEKVQDEMLEEIVKKINTKFEANDV